MPNDLIEANTHRRATCMPVLALEEAKSRFQQMGEFARDLLREDSDYGVIPGSKKRCLFKPGAEKLCTLFGLTVPDPIILSEVEDWTGEKHGGEPFFYYKVLQRLERDGVCVASQFGSCNSRESKYRWRQADRLCPGCGNPTIIKGRAEYGGGWVCLTKKGGCGSKYKDNDPAIVGQTVGRILNPDVYDLVNTVQKMAEKRSLIASVLIAVNASEFFTQDLEDFSSQPVEVVDVEARETKPAPAQQPTPATQTNPSQPAPEAKPRNIGKKIKSTEAKYVSEGLCKPGELIDYLERTLGSRWPGSPLQWPPEALETVGAICKEFAANARSKAKQAPPAQATPVEQISPEQLASWQAMLEAHGASILPELRKHLGLGQGASILNLSPEQHQKAVAYLTEQPKKTA